MPDLLRDQRIVFIDSRVPDIDLLIAGAKPGELVFVLDATKDGIQQIADTLAANHIGDLSAISIVGHGTEGALELGSTVLNDADLSGYASALSQIGASIAPGGDLQLYGCDVGGGAIGQQFITDLSHFAGGLDVAAATHAVGSADLGGSWSLDVSTGPIEADVPFTSDALASYHGVLANTLTATQSTTLLTDADGDGIASSGDTLQTQVTITNTSTTTAATAVSLSENLANQSLVGGSVTITPIATNDSYSTTGNTPITIDAGHGVLANDISPDGGALTATNIVQSDPVTHGTVTLNSNGSFTYTPDTGFSGAATFQYTAHDANGGNSNQTGTVTLTVGNPTWYVNSSAAAGGDGSSAHPFQTIGAAVTAAAADSHGGVGDTISVAAGTYSGSGITLASGEQLIGSGGVSFSVSSGTAVTLNSGNTISGINITESGSGAGITDNGSSVGTLHLVNVGVTTGSGAGITLTHGGTVDATGTNTVSTTSGTALDVENTNIGAADLTFKSISDGTGGGSAGDGIILVNTGASGGLHVTGDGSTAGSGGTIQHKTGADGTATSGIGIYLNNTSDVQLAYMTLHDFDNFAIRANNVTGFTLDHTTIIGDNGTSNSVSDGLISGVNVGEDAVRLTNLFGTDFITNSNISGGYTNTILVENTSGTLGLLTIDHSTIGGRTDNGTGMNDGINFQADNSGTVMNLTVTNSTLTTARAAILAATGAAGTSENVNFDNNTVTNDHPLIVSGGGLGVDIASLGNVNFDVSNNTFDMHAAAGGNGIKTSVIELDKGSGSGN